MRVRIVRRLSLVKGQKLQPGEVVDVGDEIALDLIQQGLAEPVRTDVERAVAAGQRV